MPKTILVVDDSRSVLAVIGTTLKVAGYNVVQASDGQEGLDILNGDEQVDMIITDLNMPNMDGMTATKKIRELGEDKNQIPIIAISGNSKNYTLEDFKNVGINEYLQKPFDYDELVEIVRKYTS